MNLLGTDAEISITNDLGSGCRIAFSRPAELVDGVLHSIDEIVSVESAGVVFGKAILRRRSRTLSSETVQYDTLNVETLIDGAPWVAVHEGYNSGEMCIDDIKDATIENFIEEEMVGLVETWFNNIVVPASILKLKCGATTTYQKGFIAVLNSIIAPYPYIRWAIDYSDPTVAFPAGDLVLVDTRTGRNTHTLTVGVNVHDASISEDALECAKNIRIRGRGKYIERGEILVPDWRPEDENIHFGPYPHQMPTEGSTIFVGGASYWNPEHDLFGVPRIRVDIGAGYVQAFYGADFTFDANTHTIVWAPFRFAPEDDMWVNEATGAVAINPLVGGYRRPLWYLGAHFGKPATIEYEYMGQQCYRHYKVSYPIANLKLRNYKSLNPFYPLRSGLQFYDKPTPVDPVIEAYLPLMVAGAFDSQRIVDYPPFNADIYRPALADIVPPMNVGEDGQTARIVSTVNAHVFPHGSPEFREGTRCVQFKDRQLSVILAYIMDLDNPIEPIWYTWSIGVRYTSWEELLDTRTAAVGEGQYVNVVYDSIYSYTDIDGNSIFDNSERFTEVGDAVLDYFGNVPFTGSMTVFVSKNVSNEWVVPYRVGDKILLNNITLPGFSAIVNGIDYGTLDEGYITLNLGRVEPARNPFAPRPPGYVDVEAPGSDLSDILGVQRL